MCFAHRNPPATVIVPTVVEPDIILQDERRKKVPPLPHVKITEGIALGTGGVVE